MSQQALTTGIAELAPSESMKAEPTTMRTIGLIGIMMTVMGAMIIASRKFLERGPVDEIYGWLSALVGLPLIMLHAVSDGEEQVRRTYGFSLGYGLLVVAGALAIFNPAQFAFLGTLSLLGSLCFLSIFARHETDPTISLGIHWTLGIVGATLLGFALILGVVVPDRLAGTGLLCGLMGLLFLCSCLAQVRDTKVSGLIATGLIVLGIVQLVWMLIRWQFPSMFSGNVNYLVPSGLIFGMLGALYLAVGLGTVSDNHVVVLTRRELASYFTSPVVWLMLFAMGVLGGANYTILFATPLLMGRPMEEPIVASLIGTLAWIVVTFLVPAVTMRSFSEEKRAGTYEVLMSAPVRESSVLTSKFLSGWIVFGIAWVPWLLYLVGVGLESTNRFDTRPLLSFVFALMVTGAAFVAMGLFFSSVTPHQIVAAMLTFGAMFLLLILIFFVGRAPGLFGPTLHSLLGKLSYAKFWEESINGRLPLKDVVLWLSLTALWLYATWKILESRRWS